MLQTIEPILGLPPMSRFDAAAPPMFDCFTGNPDSTPFALREATWPLDERNRVGVYGGKRTRKLDFSREAAVGDLVLNEIIWKSIKGADSEMPTPRRAAFVRRL